MSGALGDTISRVTGGGHRDSPEQQLVRALKKTSKNHTFRVEFSDNGSEDPEKGRKLTVKYLSADATDGEEKSKGDRYKKRDLVVWRTFEGKDDYALRKKAEEAWKQESAEP